MHTERSLVRIGDLAKRTGKTIRAIHLYEELGLLQPATRSSGGFRLYEPSAVERVEWIERLHTMGFSLQEMRSLIREWWGAGLGPQAMSDLRALFERKLEQTRKAIHQHQQVARELEEGLAYLETCRQCDSPADVHGCVNCSQDHGMEQEPALVAGITTAPSPHRMAARTPLVRIDVRT